MENGKNMTKRLKMIKNENFTMKYQKHSKKMKK